MCSSRWTTGLGLMAITNRDKAGSPNSSRPMSPGSGRCLYCLGHGFPAHRHLPSRARAARRRPRGRRAGVLAAGRAAARRAPTPTATACSARSRTPRTRSRRRCSAPGRGSSRFEGRSSLRSWLYTISTNTCLNAIERRPKRVLPIDYGPQADPAVRAAKPSEGARSSSRSGSSPMRTSTWRSPTASPDRGHLRAAREHRARVRRRHSSTSHNQRAVLILRAVLGFSAQEVAETLDTPRRGREQRPPARPQDDLREAPRGEPAGDPARARRRGPSGWSRATSTRSESGDVEQVIAFLNRGRDLVDAAAHQLVPRPRRGAWLPHAGRSDLERWRHIPIHANGQAAVGCLHGEDAGATSTSVVRRRPHPAGRQDRRR